ncbi:MAG: MBOAT family protein [Pseudonocardiales bacterium]|nr:MBOAT family protein [Pseudonocardiales bacterium]MBV9030312.1 MBOAT family protein [Pseudonocardiales bacterium]
MSFASPMFLWYFMPAVLAAVLVAPRSRRNGIVAVAGLAFYAVGAGPTTLLLLACMVVNYVMGPAMEPDDGEPGPKRRRRMLIGVIVFDVAVLVVWKYAGFASAQAAGLASLTGLDLPTVSFTLPIGISFYTFHHISYVVDIYRGERRALRDKVSFIAYIAMFPQLVAGPIVRYREIADQLTQPRGHRLDDIATGFPRFALGLTKKVVIADSLAPMVDACFTTPFDQMTTATAWLGAVGYTLQLYFDFSGYSDMAIGLGRMLGFTLPENFARPYSSASITEFWRRWHMSLSRWFRDYVYIPLGGNRHGARTTYRNLWIVFALVGLWHGANWTFLLWGLYHGTVLVMERRRRWVVTAAEPARRLACRALTLLIVVVGWVLFRSPDVSTALVFLRHMVVPDLAGLTDVVAASLTHQRLAILLSAALVFLLPAQPITDRHLEPVRSRPATVLRAGVMTVGLLYSTLLVTTGTFSPFLYYRF